MRDLAQAAAHPGDGRHDGVHGRRGPRGHARRGGAAHRAVRAHPVRAEHREGARDAAAARPADDQQVLHRRPRAGPQHARVLRRRRASSASRSPGATRTSATPSGGSTTTSRRCSRRSTRSRRSPAPTKSHVMGLCAGGITATCARRPPGRDRRAGADRRADARRLRARQRERRARSARSSTTRRRPRRVAESAAQGLPRRPRARGRVRLAAPQRPGLELLGQQLPAGQGPAGLRHPLLERRLDEPARRRCTATSWSSRSPTTLVRPGERDGARHADRPLADHGRLVPGGRDRRPHHAVAEQLPLDAAARLRPALRALHQRPHRRARQPAGQREGELPGQRREPARGRRRGCARRPSTRARGGTTTWHGWASAPAREKPARKRLGGKGYKPLDPAPGTYVLEPCACTAVLRAPRRRRAAAADHGLDDQLGGVRAGARAATPSTSSASPTTTAARRGRAARRRRRWPRWPTTRRGC